MKYTRRDVVLGLPALMAFGIAGCSAKNDAAANDATTGAGQSSKRLLEPYKLLPSKPSMAMRLPAPPPMKMQFWSTPQTK